MNKVESQLDVFMAKLTFKLRTEGLYNDMMYHYTSSFGFNSILFNDKNMITLWASRYDCLNDTSEGKIALEMYKKVCVKMLNENKLTKELFDFFVDIKPTKTTYISYLENDINRFTRVECDRYICSFSKNNDSLAMWNYYSKGNMYEGFNIGVHSLSVRDELNINKLEYTNYKISSVFYGQSEQEPLIRNVLNELIALYSKEEETSIRYMISNYLEEWSLIFKSEYFKHEEEVRLIVSIPKKTKVSIFDIKYRNSAGYIIPYIELKFNKSTVLETSFGPLTCSEDQKYLQTQILDEQLKGSNFPHTSTTYSNIPVRY